MSIKLTEKAIKEVKKVMEEQGMNLEENVLEVAVSGGGCSGFQYVLGFKPLSEVDAMNSTTFTFGDIKANVDRKSMLMLENVTIDFHDGINKRGFAFENPNSSGGCGCGSSFSA